MLIKGSGQAGVNPRRMDDPTPHNSGECRGKSMPNHTHSSHNMYLCDLCNETIKKTQSSIDVPPHTGYIQNPHT